MSEHEAKVVTKVPVDAARAFRALTSSVEQAAIAGGAASIDPVVGGDVRYRDGRLGRVSAKVHEIVPERRLVLLVHELAWLDGWGLGPLAKPSRLAIDVEPDEIGRASVVTLRHEAATDDQARCLTREWRRFYFASFQMHLERWAAVLSAGAPKLAISRFAAFRWGAEVVAAMSGAGGRYFDVASPVVLSLLNTFTTPRTPSEAVDAAGHGDRGALRDAIDAFVGAALLEPAAANGDANDASQIARWEPHDLLFHQIAAQFGNGAWHHLGHREPPPAVRPPLSTTFFPLPEGATPPDISLGAALAERSSNREFERRPLSLRTVSALLGASARNAQGALAERWNQAWMPGKYVARPYASGGARYSSELYLFVGEDGVEATPAGIYRYCPENHRLEQLTTGRSIVDPVLGAVSSESMIRPPADTPDENVIPPLLIVITSRFGRVTFKYGGVAYDLVLKETGALLQTLYLVTAALGLAGCALGAVPGASRAIVRHCSINPLAEPVVGYYMVGLPYGRASSGGAGAKR